MYYSNAFLMKITSLVGLYLACPVEITVHHPMQMNHHATLLTPDKAHAAATLHSCAPSYLHGIRERGSVLYLGMATEILNLP